MLEKEKFISLNFLKKETFTGSLKGMRYRLCKEVQDEKSLLKVTIWPEPYCFEVTNEEQKQSVVFEFSNEGKDMAVDWLNEQYETKKEVWDSVNPYK
ncbi:GNAT family acetyltransferase [Candidatus Galacturonibacter soehngenii]|uniref:GNAT family acetyltransferase n=1 Tax=Candidatus Galacturonatibacter soehngenii TaxID=2307010 RepID=A0A7V7QN92_9FIRM|nr:GNAT family acetyltransferase [Candidatus Galacturonibacter soehngenii]KAB1440138.1 GNAT family acetyltransferase [Candidatus Galacturonibacter soehngenii]MBA4686027.1 GNAT family acetyltransferase [Candidatus Galacturonibacter soehngenii]